LASKYRLRCAGGTTDGKGHLLHPRCKRSNPPAVSRQHVGARAAVDELKAQGCLERGDPAGDRCMVDLRNAANPPNRTLGNISQ
jgi:hypothetical protein